MAQTSTTQAEITSEAELREVLGGLPSKRVATKDRPRLHPLQIEWLRQSPFCVIATSNADGTCDASPKGDPAGQLIHDAQEARRTASCPTSFGVPTC